MAAPALAPVTRQVGGRTAVAADPSGAERGQPLAAPVAELPVLDAAGRRVPFGALFRERRAVVVFVRHFLCYTCKEYVEDLARIPRSSLQEADVTLIVIGQSSYHHIEPFCKLTGYCHEIYVDPEREIYKRLGMKRGEEITSSGQSPHVKSNILSGSIWSLWRAVTGPLFDFQGDPVQQGGTLILGPDPEDVFLSPQVHVLASFDHTFSGVRMKSAGRVSFVSQVENILNKEILILTTGKNGSFSKERARGLYIHFIHRDRNRLDHKPINSVLQLVGVQHVDFTSRPPIIHV